MGDKYFWLANVLEVPYPSEVLNIVWRFVFKALQVMTFNIIHPKHLMSFVGHCGFSAGFFFLKLLGVCKRRISSPREVTVNSFALSWRLHWPKKDAQEGQKSADQIWSALSESIFWTKGHFSGSMETQSETFGFRKICNCLLFHHHKNSQPRP